MEYFHICYLLHTCTNIFLEFYFQIYAEHPCLYGYKWNFISEEVYMLKIIKEIDVFNGILLQDPTRGTHQFGLTLVGHSLGAGTAAILAILLKQDYPDLICFSFGPPGGLLSMPAQQYTQEFITSVVVGKDVVPRIGLRQMESLRADLINAIKRSVDPKVYIIIKKYFISNQINIS